MGNRGLGAALVLLFVGSVFVFSVDGIRSYTNNYFGGDAVYFLSLAARTFSSHLEHAPIGHVEGHNVLLMSGPADGGMNIYKNLHFEPSTYVTAGLYAIFGTPSALIVFYVTCFFLPLIYAAYLMTRSRTKFTYAVCAAALLYALYPFAGALATDSLRPFVLLYPAMFLFLFSVVERRPTAEKLILLNCLLLAREEAVVIAAIGIAINFAYEKNEGDGHTASAYLAGAWFAWFLAECAYFFWISDAYRFIGFSVLERSTVFAAIGAAILVAIGGYLLVRWSGYRFVPFAILGLAVLMLPAALLVVSPDNVTLASLQENRLAYIEWIFCIIIGYAAYTTYVQRSFARTLIAAIALICIGWCSVRTIHEYQVVMKDVHDDRRNGNAADVLFKARAMIPPGAPLLVDDRAVMYFYDRDNVYTFSQRPGSETLSDPWNFFPQNSVIVTEKLRHALQYVVVHVRNEETLRMLADSAGVQLLPVEQSTEYVLFRVERQTNESQ